MNIYNYRYARKTTGVNKIKEIIFSYGLPKIKCKRGAMIWIRHTNDVERYGWNFYSFHPLTELQIKKITKERNKLKKAKTKLWAKNIVLIELNKKN